MAMRVSTQTTILISQTYTGCTVAANLPSQAATTTLSLAPTTTSGWGTVTQFDRKMVLTFESPSCVNYWRCSSTAQPNPDIGGIGIMIAFLITAWAAFVFLFWAYLTGRVPEQHLGVVDRKCFRINSSRCSDKWAKTMQKIILNFSDQQLATGLAILIAGFIEAYSSQLDTHHWQFVIYLAWMSSSVHLITLSFLSTRLKERTVLRNLRIFAMVVLLVLLSIAIVPQLKMLYYETSSIQATEEYAYENWRPNLAGLPVYCFWNDRLSFLRDEHNDGHEMSLNPDAIISYSILCIGYLWKLGQLFSFSSQWMRRWFLAKPSVALEAIIDRQYPVTSKRKFLKHWLCRYIYVLFLLLTEGFNSFVFTLVFLGSTLAWGSLQLWLTRRSSPESNLQAESRLSFGQLLPLLLLLQPLSAILEHLLVRYSSPFKKRSKAEAPVRNNAADQEPHKDPGLIQKQPTMTIFSQSDSLDKTTLSEIIKRRTLRTVEDKMINASDDTVLAHVCQSRVFRGMIYLCVTTLLALPMAIMGIVGKYGKDQNSRIFALQISPLLIIPYLIFFACCISASRRLR